MQVNPPEKDWGLISICENGDFPPVHENEFLRGRLNLQFHDIDEFKRNDPENIWDLPEDYDKPDVVLFDEEHARRIVEWVILLRERNVSVVFIHCLMGQCRSAGVAAALDKVLNGDDSKYFGSRSAYRPNMRVYRGVMNECVEKGLIG